MDFSTVQQEIRKSLGNKPAFFYGYVIVMGTFLISLLTVGAQSSFGIFFKPLSLEHGWTRATTAGADSLSYLIFGPASILAGRLTDKLGPKVVLITCGLFLGLGYLLMSKIDSIWQLYVFYGLIVGAGMAANNTPLMVTVSRWFVKKRGLVTGVTKTGAGIGILSIPILSSWLISIYGWRDAYIVLGIIVLIGVVIAALILKRDPAEMGLLPDGAKQIEDTNFVIVPPQFSLRDAISTSQFWIFAVVWFMVSFCVRVVIVHTVNNITDLGILPNIAAMVLSAIGGFSIAGRVGFGIIGDRLGARSAFIIALFLLTLSLAWIQLARETWMFYLFAMMYGIAQEVSSPYFLSI